MLNINEKKRGFYMHRRRVRIFVDGEHMIYPYDVAYGTEYDDTEEEDLGKPYYASYYWDVNEGVGKPDYQRYNLKLYKYDGPDYDPIMSNLGPRDVNGVMIFEKDLLQSPDGVVYVVDYDEVGCYNYLEDVSGNRTFVYAVDVTTFAVIGNILQHKNTLFV